MITVYVQYHAMLREQRGLARERIVTAGKTAADLRDELWKKHRFELPTHRVRAAINDEIRPWHTVLKNHDRVAFLPPVAGG